MPDGQGKPSRARRPKPGSGAGSSTPPDTGYGDHPSDDEGEAVEGHAEFVARHFGGGVEATPDLLDRAIEVWQRLPGAVVRGPAQIRPNRPVVAADDDEDAVS